VCSCDGYIGLPDTPLPCMRVVAGIIGGNQGYPNGCAPSTLIRTTSGYPEPHTYRGNLSRDQLGTPNC